MQAPGGSRNPLRRPLREALDALASLIFPAPCRICGAVLASATRIPICQPCLDSLRPFPGPACQKCGRPFVSVRAAEVARPLCQVCRRGVYAFDLARSYGRYEDAMVSAITLLKYHAVRPLGGWFAARLTEVIAREPKSFVADVVAPVPLHPARLRERGYNQAELIARPLARAMRLPLNSLLLVRTKPRPEKLKLTRKERWRTVRGAYVIRPGSQVDKQRVLLVDDVFTTGATLDACARALHQAGASSVIGITVARAVPDWASGIAAPERAGVARQQDRQ